MNKIIVFILLLIVAQLAEAQSKFIKYKQYLIPISSLVVEVRTDSASEITSNTAKLNGTLISGRNVQTWFILSNGTPQECTTPPQNTELFIVSEGERFSKTRAGLQPGQNFQYRACARNASNSETISGDIQPFRTADSNTEARTLAATTVTATTARLRGQIISGTNVFASFFISTSSNIQCSSSTRGQVFNNRNTGDIVEATINTTNVNGSSVSLLSNTQYFYRLCATNPRVGQTVGGNVLSFTTNGDGDALIFDPINSNSRTDQSVTVVGRLARAGNPKNTWFVLLEGDTTFTDLGCRNLERLNVRQLASTNSSNSFTISNLEDNTLYTVGFCGEGSSNGTSYITIGATRQFITKRNSSTIVNHECSVNRVFSSDDGPLNVIVSDSNINSIRDDASPITIRNLGSSNNVNFRRFRSQFAAQNGGNLSVNARREARVFIVAPPLSDSINGSGSRDYQVVVDPTGNWEAEFGCRVLNCLSDNAGLETIDQQLGLCNYNRPLN